MDLVLKLVSSGWFWVDVAFSISGGGLVYLGLAIEKNAEKYLPPADFKPDIFADAIAPYKAALERGWRILMFGIALEVVAALGISVISGLEIASIKERTAKTESNNLVLRTNVSSLETAVLQLAKQYDMSTNALAEANARLSIIKPAKEQLIDCLNLLSDKIIPTLRNGSFRTVLNIDSSLIVRLEEFSKNPETSKYISVRRTGNSVITSGFVGHEVEIELNTSLVK